MEYEVYANSGLGRWFGKGGEGSSSGGGWNRYNSSGKNVGKCGDAKKGSSYSACLGKKYVARLRSKGGKKAIANWVKRKKSAQNKAGRGEKGSGGKGQTELDEGVKQGVAVGEGVGDGDSQGLFGVIDGVGVKVVNGVVVNVGVGVGVTKPVQAQSFLPIPSK